MKYRIVEMGGRFYPQVRELLFFWIDFNPFGEKTYEFALEKINEQKALHQRIKDYKLARKNKKIYPVE